MTGFKHGVDCEKILHSFNCVPQEGYLHDEYDDRPYDVDGIVYCGRCHIALPNLLEDL